jgi:hypothetical protein
MKETTRMSEQDNFWISFGQRFFGLILLIIGIVLVYFTVTSIAEFGAFTAFFVFLSVVLVAVGVVLLIAKPRE